MIHPSTRKHAQAHPFIFTETSYSSQPHLLILIIEMIAKSILLQIVTIWTNTLMILIWHKVMMMLIWRGKYPLSLKFCVPKQSVGLIALMLLLVWAK